MTGKFIVILFAKSKMPTNMYKMNTIKNIYTELQKPCLSK